MVKCILVGIYREAIQRMNEEVAVEDTESCKEAKQAIIGKGAEKLN